MWALNRVNIIQNKKRNNKGTNNNNNTNTKKPHIVVPYIKGMGESCKNICRKHGVEVNFKGAAPSKTS